jgi:hypothetical protein
MDKVEYAKNYGQIKAKNAIMHFIVASYFCRWAALVGMPG